MQCPCGGETTTHNHAVKTIHSARAWYPKYNGMLPVIVSREVCGSCERQMMREPIPWTTEETR